MRRVAFSQQEGASDSLTLALDPRRWPALRFLVREHALLLEGIQQGDPAAAVSAARRHLEAVWYRMEETGAPVAPGGEEALWRSVAFIGHHLHEPLHLADLARDVAFISSGHLSRLFRTRYGMGFQAYLQALRLSEAANLLAQTGLPITTVAHRIGYADVSRFGEHFKRRFGVPPRVWRRTQAGHRDRSRVPPPGL